MNFSRSFLLIFYLACLSAAQQQHACKLRSSVSNGTTRNLEQIFKGRCHYFLNLRHNADCFLNTSSYNCTHIWTAFKSAVIGKTPCNVTMEDYAPFLRSVNHSIPANATLFWSGAYRSAQDCMQMIENSDFLGKNVIFYRYLGLNLVRIT